MQGESTHIIIDYLFLTTADNDKSWLDNLIKYIQLAVVEVFRDEDVVFHPSHEQDGNVIDAKAFVVIVNKSDQDAQLSPVALQMLERKKTNPAFPIVKIVKNNAFITKQPGEFSLCPEYPFYLYDVASSRVSELEPDKMKELSKFLFARIFDLLYDIKFTLSPLKSQQQIFLAEVSIDQYENRSIIKRELLHHGYQVLPDCKLSLDTEKLEVQLNTILQKSFLSVHIIGSEQGDAIQHSFLPDFQNAFASTFMINDNRPETWRIVWVDPTLHFRNNEQQINIERLKRNTAALAHAELVETPIEVLKSIILKKLKQEDLNNSHRKEDDSNRKSIYFIYMQENEKDAVQVEKLLEDKGFNVLLSSFNTEHLQNVSMHIENLRKCDATLIYYKQGNPEWINSKMQDIMKAPGFGRSKPMLARGILTESKEKLDKHSNQHFFEVLETSNNNLDTLLKPFIDKVIK